MKIKSETDCASGRDYFAYAQAQGWDVKKNGSYWEISDPKTGQLITRFPDSARCLPKETRTTINAALVKAGLLVVVVLAVLGWVVL
jgi:hypothetical protein